MSNINQISSILNAPKWKFKEPTRHPPKLNLNSLTINTTKTFKEHEPIQLNQERICCCINNYSFSTNSESEEEYQPNICIFNLIVQRK